MKNKIDELKNRLKESESTTTEKRAAAADIMAKYTDAKGAQRGALSREWAEAQAELTLLDAERVELQSRLDAASLAPLKSEYESAEREAIRLSEEATAARQNMQTVANERLHFMNRGGRKAITPEGELSIVEMETKAATAKAESRIASQKAQRAASARDQAKEAYISVASA